MTSRGRHGAVVAAITAMLIVGACSKSDSPTGSTTGSRGTATQATGTSGAPETTRAAGSGGSSTSSRPSGSSTTTTSGSGSSSASTAPSGSIPTYGANNTAITAPSNSEFAIKLDSNASTGYSWRYKTDATNLVLVSETTEPPSSNAIGAGGAQIFTFRAGTAGSAELIFVYSRSAPSADDSTLKFTVTVT